MEVKKYIEDEDGALYSKDGLSLFGYNPDVFRCLHYQIPNGVMKIEANAFLQCQSLKSVYMPDSIVEDDGSIFEGCKNLETARISANLKHPDIAMFCGCASLQDVELPEGIESIGENMFCNCKSLRNLVIPSTVKSLCGDTFSFSGIEEIELPEGLKSIGANAFRGCYNLCSLTIPSTVDSIGPWLVQGHKDFDGIICNSDKFRIEDESLICNKDNTLLACWTKRKEYHLPSSVKNVSSLLNDQIETLYIDYPLDEIGYEAFVGCPSLQDIVFNSTVQNNKSADWATTT